VKAVYLAASTYPSLIRLVHRLPGYPEPLRDLRNRSALKNLKNSGLTARPPSPAEMASVLTYRTAAY